MFEKALFYLARAYSLIWYKNKLPMLFQNWHYVLPATFDDGDWYGITLPILGISSCISVLVTMEVSYQCSFPSQTSIGESLLQFHRMLDIPSLISQVCMHSVLTLLCWSGLAPAPRSSSTTLWWPSKLARCSAVTPFCRVECTPWNGSCTPLTKNPTTWQVTRSYNSCNVRYQLSTGTNLSNSRIQHE